MSELKAKLRPLSQPVAVFPQYIARAHPTTLLVKGTSIAKMSRGVFFTGSSIQTATQYQSAPQSQPEQLTFNNDIPYSSAQPVPAYAAQTSQQDPASEASSSDDNGPLLFHVDGRYLSFSDRKAVIDATTGTKLCEIRRETFSLKYRYYVETSDNGPRCLETEKQISWGNKNIVRILTNQAGQGEEVTLFVKKPAFKLTQEIYLGDNDQGQLIATIERELWHWKHHYNLTVAQGLDLFIVATIAVITDEILNAKQ